MKWFVWTGLALVFLLWTLPIGCSPKPSDEETVTETTTETPGQETKEKVTGDTTAETVADTSDGGTTEPATEPSTEPATEPSTEPTAELPTETTTPDGGDETTTPETVAETQPETTTETVAETVAESKPDGGSGGGVPTNGADLLKYLQAGSYQNWKKESAVHSATLGSPHGAVRVFINSAMDSSLSAGNTSHPVGAASVKELYQNDKTTLKGYAVMVKTAAGAGAGTWYWYEIISGSVVADGKNISLCTGCHSPGKDFFRSTYPLQ